jgi:hypothetical protein
MLTSHHGRATLLRGSLIPRMSVPVTVVASAVAEQGPAYWPGLLDQARLALRTQRLSRRTDDRHADPKPVAAWCDDSGRWIGTDAVGSVRSAADRSRGIAVYPRGVGSSYGRAPSRIRSVTASSDSPDAADRPRAPRGARDWAGLPKVR